MILVIAEQKGGVLNRASWEALVAAQQLSAGATPIHVAVIGHQDRAGPRPAIGDLGNVLKRFDVNVVTRQGMTDRCAAAEIAIDQGKVEATIHRSAP